jgi:NAD(P)H dehydrogenase (quinone)
MAHRVATAAEAAGAEVRLRHIAETRDPESFAQNPAWSANYEATKDLPAATGDDIIWADAIIFGSPPGPGQIGQPFHAVRGEPFAPWARYRPRRPRSRSPVAPP